MNKLAIGACGHGVKDGEFCSACQASGIVRVLHERDVAAAEARGFERGVREALEIAERREVVSWSVASAIRARIRSMLPPSDETPA